MSSLQIGIVGLPNVGKSTLFNTLTKSSVLAANYPFATIDPNVGIVPVPDKRLSKLAALYNSQKIIPATVTFVDIAGLVKGASKGEGLGNQFLGHIRSTSAIIEVVRLFSDSLVTKVNENSTPKDDIDVILTELILADLETVNRRLPIIEKEVKSNPKHQPKLKALKLAYETLNSGKPVSSQLNNELLEELSDLQLLTAKPIIYTFNTDEESIINEQTRLELDSYVSPAKSIYIPIKLENEFSNLDDIDASELRLGYNLKHSALENLISAAYETLGLQSFITAGEKEVRAWTIPKGSTAPKAAGAIHGDFERGFIAAEIVNYNDLIELGSIAACRSAGKIRTEGKTYIMQPDDVVEFRFNV